jgi:hypothetical protein
VVKPRDSEDFTMIRSAIEQELRERIAALRPRMQEQVLAYVWLLSTGRPTGAPARDLLNHAGTIAQDDLAEIARIIKEDCERIDHDGWQVPP